MTALPAAVKERAKALRNLRYWWKRTGPLDTDTAETVEDEELMMAVKRFMDADEAMRAAQSDLAAGVPPNA